MLELTNIAKGNQFLTKHLHLEFNRLLGHIKTLHEDPLLGNIHPLIVQLVFCANKDGLGMHMHRMPDFLEKKTKRPVTRKLCTDNGSSTE